MISLPNLPERTEVDKNFNPSYEAGNFLISNYCSSCKLQPTCKINEAVRLAMGNNYLCWPEEWVPLKVRDVNAFDSLKRTVICKEYSPLQKLLFESSPGQSVVEKLESLIREGKFVEDFW